MSKQKDPETGKRKKKQGRGAPSLLCRVLGTGILVGVILVFLPLTAPRLAGYQFYEVVSASMAPEIEVGSVICVDSSSPEEIGEGEIIAFQREESVVTHRVETNRVVEGEFVTKGDANAKEDMAPVPYAALIGRVVWHAPMLGTILTALLSPAGKVYLVMFLACGVMFHMLAGRLDRRKE